MVYDGLGYFFIGRNFILLHVDFVAALTVLKYYICSKLFGWPETSQNAWTLYVCPAYSHPGRPGDDHESAYGY